MAVSRRSYLLFALCFAMKKDFLISVICTTYNRPDALSAVLTGLSRQTDSNFEVVIADDGSTPDTRKVISKFQSQAQFRLLHAWQEDKGFRAAAARNLAFNRTQGEYILLLDGDCIPSPNWIKNHRCLAERSWSVPGQRILTSQAFCTEILVTDDFVSTLNWSPSHFRELSRKKLVNRWGPSFCFGLHRCSFWRKLSPNNWKKARSCNWGIWRDDFLTVNGFNESLIGWGHEDADLAIRLMNAGIKFKSGSFATTVLHLWHKEESRDSANQNWCVATSNLKNKL